MNNNEINPRLKELLESLQETPARDSQSHEAGRVNFLSQAKNIQPRQTPTRTSKTRAGTPLRKFWVPRLATILAVVLFALSSIGGTVYAAQDSLPDDLLYPVKTLTEDIQIGLESDPEERLDLYASFANRRLEEIEAQIQAGEKISPKALARLEKLSEKMLQQAAQMGEKGLENALRQIQQALEKQNQMMEKLQKQTPGGGAPGLVKAQEKIRERLELVENGINEPQGFIKTIKERKEKSDQPGQGNDNSNKPDTPPGLEDKDNNGKGNDKGINDSEVDPTLNAPGNDS
ncbi:MAG: hypothetical protein HQ574_02385 [Chloroflexi bacterium]|nr:hypothetical protein [Chloroflexota bacterium]